MLRTDLGRLALALVCAQRAPSGYVPGWIFSRPRRSAFAITLTDESAMAAAALLAAVDYH